MLLLPLTGSAWRGTAAPATENCWHLPATVGTETTGSSFSEGLWALGSAVTQVTWGWFSPQLHCLILVWETLLLHIHWTNLAAAWQGFTQIPSPANSWPRTKGKGQALAPRSSHLCACLMGLCKLWWQPLVQCPTPETSPPHYFSAYPHIPFLSCKNIFFPSPK